MSLSTLAVSQWMLARLMPPAQADALIGDLIEELRLQAGSHVSVTGWYSRQLASSVSVLLWASMRRGAWLVTVVTAVACFIAAIGTMRVLQSALWPMTTSSLAHDRDLHVRVLIDDARHDLVCVDLVPSPGTTRIDPAQALRMD